MSNSEVLFNASKRFENLKMPYQAKALDENGNEVILTHPYQALISMYYDFEVFKSSFADLETNYSGPVGFEDFLKNIYNDLLVLPAIIESMNKGVNPPNFEKVSKSISILKSMMIKMLQITNTKLAKVIH